MIEEIGQTMRNPGGLKAKFETRFSMGDLACPLFDPAFTENSAESRNWQLISYCSASGAGQYVSYRYGYGASMAAVVAMMETTLPQMHAAVRYLQSHPVPERDDTHWRPLRGINRHAYRMAAFSLLLMPAARVDDFSELLNTSNERGYLFDVLVHAFVPTHLPLKKYTADKYSADWTNPILAALARPPAERAAALAAHMKNWTRLMRRYGWKPVPSADDIPFFNEFAYEVALAVCAYDLDDSAFNQHPWYPGDLVEFYRANLRHTRDAWRPAGQGAGIAVVAPPPPKKADLAKSKRKGIARWIELACDGDVDATEAVLEAVGKPRKLKQIDGLMAALGENQQAIEADIKDDATLAVQAALLGGARGLGDYEAPPGPPHGPARCSATLSDFAGWTGQRGYRLVDLDGQDDGWHAVLVRGAYHGELLELGAALGIVARAPAPA